MSSGPDHWGKHLRRRAATLAAAAAVIAGPAVGVAEAGTVPPGFQETTAFSGFTNPSAITFAPDGRVFVGEKSGLIKVFDGLSDTTATISADLRTETHNFWDRGLLGLTIDPQFSSGRPYLYALYTLDKAPGAAEGTIPRWGAPGVSGDPCPTPPGATQDGCVVSGRLARLTVGGGSTITAKTDLITDWCQQYPSHSVGDLAFGADGKLYVSAGDGASFNFVDWGQDGSPVNPCGDPPGGVGGAMTPPSAEGGALRSQDARTTSDPTGLDGALLRIDPDTGAGVPGNPFAASPDANQRRIAAFGFRNPFRLTVRPGSNEIWLGDVGWNNWEEVNRVVDPTGAAENLGWPCYEGAGANGSYDGANLSLCESLYSGGGVTAPHYAYPHSGKVVAGETCPQGSSSISGLRFYESGDFPNSYNGALFFSDYSRDCIWAMFPGGGGLPNPASIQTFDAGAANPVDLEIHDGEVFYADFDGGTIRRVRYTTGNQAPNADAAATPSSGPPPLDVELDASGSSDPDDAFGELDFAWDADNDGAFDDGTGVTLDRTYGAGSHVARVRVTDPDGETGTDSVTIVADSPDEPPIAQITAPVASTSWAVGDTVSFSGTATDDGALTASSYDWELLINHCPSNCHQHAAEQFADRTSGSFSAPDHEYPSSLTLRLTVTDSDGLSDTAEVEIDPRTVEVTVAATPIGLQVGLNSETGASPLTKTVIEGSQNTAIAPSEQTLAGAGYAFASWSDGGAATHNFVADEDMALVATFVAAAAPPLADTTPPDTVITGRPAARTHIKKRGPSDRARRPGGGKATFTFSATEPVSGFACSFDGASFTACATPLSYAALKRGTHRFRVRAKDLAGNVDPTPASYSFLCVIKKKTKKKP